MAIEAAAEIGEAEQQAQRIAAVEGAFVQRLQALGIIGPAVAQMRAEDALQFGETGKTQRLGETHQRRGLHLRALGNARSGAERDFIRVFERERRRLAQALGQFRLDVDEATLERVEVLRRVHDFLLSPHGRKFRAALCSRRPRPPGECDSRRIS